MHVGSSSIRCLQVQCDQMLKYFLQKLLKKYPHQLTYIKSAILHNSPKLLIKIGATFARITVPLNLNKSTNLATLFRLNIIMSKNGSVKSRRRRCRASIFVLGKEEKGRNYYFKFGPFTTSFSF